MQNLIDKFVEYPESRNRNDMYWADKKVSRSQCGIAVRDIIGLDDIPSFETDAKAKLYFRYAVDYLWVGEFSEPAEVWKVISKKVDELTTALPWTGKDEDPNTPNASSLTSTKEVKVKKKTQQECVREWWIENLESLKGESPKEIQDRFSEECDVHRNSARGLYYKLKKEYPIPA
jgi:hypothetical protein